MIQVCPSITLITIFDLKINISKKQTGAELCQAQVKLGLAKTDLFFHLIEKLGPFAKTIEVVFNLKKK